MIGLAIGKALGVALAIGIFTLIFKKFGWKGIAVWFGALLLGNAIAVITTV